MRPTSASIGCALSPPLTLCCSDRPCNAWMAMQDAGSVGLLHERLADLPTRRAHGSHAGPTRLFAHPNATAE